MISKLFVAITVSLALFSFRVYSGGAPVIQSSVMDGSGTVSSGGALTNISAAGQPGGVAVSEGGSFVNQAGFLNTFLLKPSLDTDGDGVVDELDQDNDNDGLTDISEINGSSFSPFSPTHVNMADTDGDGIIDGFEAASGTDPDSEDSFLRLVAISNAPLGRGIAWLARGNNEKTYVVRAFEDLDIMNGAVVYSNTVAGGSAPWFAVTTSVVSVSSTNNQYFAVEVYP